jgi:hypothetical protein
LRNYIRKPNKQGRDEKPDPICDDLAPFHRVFRVAFLLFSLPPKTIGNEPYYKHYKNDAQFDLRIEIENNDQDEPDRDPDDSCDDSFRFIASPCYG